MYAMTSHPVEALEYARCNALVVGDVDRVASMLAPDLVYVHAPGLVHGREALLQFLREQVRFHLVERRALVVHAAGDLAWSTGLLRLVGERMPGGAHVVSASFVTQVWRRYSDGWQMVLFQSTRVDDSQWNAVR